MSIASLSKIEKTFGPRVIFDRVDLTIYPGERIGLIGPNGAGKTTLFKILTGQVEPDDGQMSLARDVKVGYLAQDPVLNPDNTVIDEAELAFAQLHELAHQLRELEHAMAEHQGEQLEKTLNDYQRLQHDFDLGGGYVWHHRLEATLLGVGLGRETWEQKVSTLSGGQRSTLALAKLLISEPDLLLLDEPTNHLDLAAIEWLEDYLLAFRGAVILISHDRYLLDRLATRIVWLHQRRLESFKGNYSDFVKQRELIELTQERAFDQQQAYIEKQQEFIRRFQANQRARQAKGRASRLDTLLHSEQLVRQSERQKQIKLTLSTDQRAGDRVLELRNLSKSYGAKKLWEDVRLEVTRGERLGIIGPNGSGKTTLLKVLLGEEDADHGELKWGANLNIGYYDQRLDEFNPENTVIEETLGDREATDKQLRDVLAMLLFRGDDIYKPVGLLSGGERARVRLAQLLLDRPNVLVLDEPTNHLDIASCEALEGTLRDFPGTIFCVSHDRYFLNRVIQRLLVLRPPGWVDFEGSYTAWTRKLHEEAHAKSRKEAAAREAPKPAAAAAVREAKKDNPYKRPFGRLSSGELEKEIAQTEANIAKTQAQFGDAASFKDPTQGQKLQQDYERLTQRLEALEQEYFAREE
jgi:ATP-binding cassette subfamily F protein 3